MSETKTNEIKQSVEYRHGATHRHHGFDYHPMSMPHPLPYHNRLDGTVFQELPGSESHETAKLTALSQICHNAIVECAEYTIGFPVFVTDTEDGCVVVNVRGQKECQNYRVEIWDGKWNCDCPSASIWQRHGIPCKHVIMVARSRGLKIKIGI